MYLYIQVGIYMYRHVQRYMDRVCVYIYSIYIAAYIYRLCRNVYTKWQQKPTYIYIFILYIIVTKCEWLSTPIYVRLSVYSRAHRRHMITNWGCPLLGRMCVYRLRVSSRFHTGHPARARQSRVSLVGVPRGMGFTEEGVLSVCDQLRVSSLGSYARLTIKLFLGYWLIW